MKRFAVIGLASGLILYILPLVLIYIFQRNFMYFPPKAYLSPQSVGLDVATEIRHHTDAGQEIIGWWIPPEDETKPVVLFFHGNASAVYSNHDIYRDLSEQGVGVYALGYVGYPGSEGKPEQIGIVAGARTQYDWVVSQGVEPKRISFYGTSLGSGIAAQLALERRPSKLILEAPFHSTLDMARLSMPVFPVKWLMKDQFRTDLALRHFDMPFYWLHGTADEVVPFSQGQRLYETYEGPKYKYVVEGGRHTNLWALGGREFILKAIEQ